MNVTALNFSLLAVAIGLEILGQLLFKVGVSKRRTHNRRPAATVGPVSRPWIAAGVVVYLVELVFWIAALSSLPLSQAFPLLSLSYAGVAVAAWLIFDEKLSTRAVFGIMLLTAGAALMVAS